MQRTNSEYGSPYLATHTTSLSLFPFLNVEASCRNLLHGQFQFWLCYHCLIHSEIYNVMSGLLERNKSSVKVDGMQHNNHFTANILFSLQLEAKLKIEYKIRLIAQT